MARNFNANRLEIADDPALSLGDDVDSSGPFSFSFWLRCDPMAGVGNFYPLSWGVVAASPSANILIHGDDHLTLSGIIRFIFEGSGGKDLRITFSDAVNDGQWHHVVIAFDGTTIRAWVDNSLQANTDTEPEIDTIDVANHLHLGVYTNHGARFLGDMAEWAKWDVALSTEQITALAAGVRPPEVGTRPAWYLPMLAGLDEEIAGLAVTNNGTTVSEHPPRIVPSGNMVVSRFDATRTSYYYQHFLAGVS